MTDHNGPSDHDPNGSWPNHLHAVFQGDQQNAAETDLTREETAWELFQEDKAAGTFQRKANAALDVSYSELADAGRDLVKAITVPLAVGILVRLIRKPVAK